MSIIKHLSVLLTLIFISCNSNVKFEKEDFDQFLKRTSSDSIFQKKRVKFPIKLTFIDENLRFKKDMMTEENWIFTNFLNPSDKNFIIKIDSLSPKIKTVNYTIDDTGFFVTYFFKLINKKWFLVSIKDEST